MSRNAAGKLNILMVFLAAPLSIIMFAGYFSISFVKYELKHIAASLPAVPEPYNVSRVGRGTYILDGRGEALEHFAATDQKDVSLEEIPSLVPDAFIAAEDKNFWKHEGVDFQALMRAILSQVKGGHGSSGGSTLAEQLAKNIAIGNEHTWRRKVREALYARRLVHQWGRKTVLSAYLNTVYLGQGAYGIEAASQVWFGKDVRELLPPEAAFLAGLPKAPSEMNPVHHYQRAHERRHYVLSRMCALGMIDCGKLPDYDAYPLPIPRKSGNDGAASSWYGEVIRRQAIVRMGVSRFYGEMGASATIKSFFDPALSDIAYRALLNGLVRYEQRHGFPASGAMSPHMADWKEAVIASCGKGNCHLANGEVASFSYPGRPPGRGEDVWVRPHGKGLEIVRVPLVQGSVIILDRDTGHVLAEIGGLGEPGGFDRNMQSRRQPGSIAKIAVTWAALQHGYHPDTAILDVPVSIGIDGGKERWMPGGDGLDDGMGLIDLKKAFADSRNQAYVRIANDLGWNVIGKTWSDLGLYDRTDLPPSAVLGGIEARPIDVATMMGRVLTGNMLWQPSFSEEGSLSQPAAHGEREKDDEGLARRLEEMKLLLKNVVAHGTAYRPFAGMKIDEIGGKTGTSNNVRDSWFAGFAGKHVFVVHVGYDNGKPLGEHEFGSTIAAPIVSEIVSSLKGK